MVRVTNGAYGRLAHLECDVCGEELRYGIAIAGIEVPSGAVHSNLREQAQKAGWTAVLGRGGAAWRDLCPECFTMPPEA
jgi:hypothetical protein